MLFLFLVMIMDRIQRKLMCFCNLICSFIKRKLNSYYFLFTQLIWTILLIQLLFFFTSVPIGFNRFTLFYLILIVCIWVLHIADSFKIIQPIISPLPFFPFNQNEIAFITASLYPVSASATPIGIFHTETGFGGHFFFQVTKCSTGQDCNL